eukprot:gene2210-2979_t
MWRISAGGGGGMLLGLLPLVFSRFGCGGVAVLLIVFAVFGGGLNLLGGGGGGQLSAPTAQVGAPGGAQGGHDTQSSCTLNAASKAACNALSSADKTWAAIFQQSGESFTKPKLVFYGSEGQSGCGAAQSAMGPFYCPQDRGIYLDTSVFDELANRFGAKGDFAQDYVIAHEFGHHIQNLLGTSDKVASAQRRASETEGNALSVRLELQADCYAGVWARAHLGDPSQLPGVAAMIPDSPLVRWLHAADAPVPGALRVLAGDLEGDSVGSWLKTLMADAFYWTDNDLVVQTRSMYGGAPRERGASFVLDQGGRV